MADVARPAHLAGVSLWATAVTLGLALGPRPVHAEPAPAARIAAEAEPVPDPKPEPSEATPAVDDTEALSPDEPEPVPSGLEDEAEPAVAVPTPAGDADELDDSASRASGPTAEPLRPLQTAAWWTMFGAFAVGTTAGVLAGLAERQEDRATRLSTLFDIQTGAQPLYADRKDEYEQYLRRGEGYARAAIGVGVVAGLATIAAITVFAVDARRQRAEPSARERRRATLRVRGGGMEVRF